MLTWPSFWRIRVVCGAGYLRCLTCAGQQLGPVMLYFGCRHKAQDFIYQRELEAWQQEGTLQLLSTAFSRDGPQKDYVQVVPLGLLDSHVCWPV